MDHQGKIIFKFAWSEPIKLSTQPRSWCVSVGRAGFAAQKKDGGKTVSVFQKETNRVPEYTGGEGGLHTENTRNLN